jgi:hypothetical protein
MALPSERGCRVGSAPACLVTGYVRLDSGHRNHERYVALGQQLVDVGVPTIAAVDPSVVLRSRGGLLWLHASLERCWYWRQSDGAALPDGTAGKDTRSFLSVQHQKTGWLAEAARYSDADMLVWVDFGIFHVPGITADGVRLLVKRAETMSRDRIGMASIWGPPTAEVPPQRVAWNCAGGVLVVPRHMAAWLDMAVRMEAKRQLNAGHTTWEVNTWANVWRLYPEWFDHWRCDHNGTILAGIP